MLKDLFRLRLIRFMQHLCEFSASSTFRFSFYPSLLFFFRGVGADIHPRSVPQYGVSLGALNQINAVKAAEQHSRCPRPLQARNFSFRTSIQWLQRRKKKTSCFGEDNAKNEHKSDEFNVLGGYQRELYLFFFKNFPLPKQAQDVT